MSFDDFDPNGRLHPTTLRTLRTLDQYIVEHEHAPSIRELCELTHIASISNVAHHLDLLEGKELIEIRRVGLHQKRAAHTARLTAAGHRVLARHSGPPRSHA